MKCRQRLVRQRCAQRREHPLLPTMTWAQIAQTMRVTGSSEWRSGLTVAATAAPHQVLWLLVGGDTPCPRLSLKGGYHRALVDALVSQLELGFESKATAEAKRVARARSLPFDLLAARATIASSLPWSAPADLQTLRTLMLDPKGAAAKLRDALSAASVPVGTLLAP